MKKYSTRNDKRFILDKFLTWFFGYNIFMEAFLIEPARVNIIAKSAIIKNILTVRKQPISRSGYRRGQKGER